MEYRNRDDHVGISSFSLGYNSSPPPSLRGSAFSKPTLPPSTTLISSRVGGGGGGVISTGAAGTRNDSLFGDSTLPAAPPSAAPVATSVSLLRLTTASVDHPCSSQSHGKAPDPIPIPSSSPSSLAVGGVSSNPKAATSNAAPKVLATSTTTNNTAATVVDDSCRYRGCLRNHAASTGGHVVDGCGEFMPNGEPSTPEALMCAACGCHRSFHRKEVDGDINAAANSYYRATGPAHFPFLLPPPHPQAINHPQNPHTPKQFQIRGLSSSPSPAVAGYFGGNTNDSGGTTTESSSEELIHSGIPTPTAGAPKKRFRTKFTPEQKEKMMEFAERVGWRFQKQDEAVLAQFCAEVGIRRQVLKVWMHNNKHPSKKQQQLPS